MKWKRVLGLLIFFSPLFFISIVFAKELLPLKDCTFKADSRQLAIILEFPKKVTYHCMLFSNPDRLVTDINMISLSSKLALPENDFVKTYRASDHDHAYLRLVFDLKTKVAYTTAYDTEKHILTITLSKSHYAAKEVTLPKEQAELAEEELTPIRLSKNLELKKEKLNQEDKVNSVQNDTVNMVASDTLTSEKIKEPVRLSTKDIVIVIDPGHGGKDPGAAGPNGTKEKEVVLKISKQLQTMLNDEPGFHAVLTRSSDCYLSLRKRLAIARQNHADMFIAIHADAYHHSQATGASVYALSQRGATSEAARWLAEKENESELGGLSSELADKDAILRSVLIDLSQTHTIKSSLLIGNTVLQNLGNFSRLHHPSVEQAAFVVLKSPDIPSILVETGFLSNPEEEDKLINPSYQHQTALAIKEGIKHYFVSHSAGGTWFTEQNKASHQVAIDEMHDRKTTKKRKKLCG